MSILPLYVVPASTINGFYAIEEALCILLILLVVIISIFEVNRPVKLTITGLSLITVFLHYYLLVALAGYEGIAILPLFFIESVRKGSTIVLDYGQIIIYGLIYLWRKQVARSLHKIAAWLRRV